MNLKKRVPKRFPAVDSLSNEEAREAVDTLRQAIDHHDHLYYVKNEPVISDAAYDRLFGRLQELEAAFPELEAPDSPTRRVGGAPLEELERVEHVRPLLSLQAVQDADGIERFDGTVRGRADGRVRYVLEPKFDGFSVEVVYRGGRFDHGATRGDGAVGEDVSENLKTIHVVPLRLREPDTVPQLLSVRGEVFLRRGGFQQMNRARIESGDEPFANPRNAAAGMMRQLDPSRVAGYPFDVVFYELIHAGDDEDGKDGRDERDGEGVELETHRDVLDAFARWGLKTDPRNRVVEARGDVERFHQRLLEERDALDYEIDGIVVKVDDLALRERLGTRHRSPRWALAWKFPPREEVTTIEDIVVQVGRTGILTPVALLAPVDVSGVTVSRATLHNEGELARKDVRVGDRVRVARAGDVIPEIVERVKRPGKKRGPPFSMPRRCPSCGGRVEEEGAYRICTAGLACPAQLTGRLLHYGSRDALDIDGLGSETARQLVERELVQTVADLYELEPEQICGLEGFAEKSAHALHDAIQGARSPRLDRFVYGLGIPRVGRRTAELLAEELRSLDALTSAKTERVERIEGIGPEVAHAVTRFFQDPANRRVLRGLSAAGVEPTSLPRRPRHQPLAGKRFVFTGGLENWTRAEAKGAVEALGGHATSSVSGETDYLVVGESPGSKLDDAREHGVTVLSEAEFAQLVGA